MDTSLEAARDNVLVAIVKTVRDFALARESHWYRIPQSSVEKWLSNRWPPRWLAFYHTNAFRRDSHCIRFYAEVQGLRLVQRWELFPGDPRDEKSHLPYYQLLLGPLHELAQPIISRRIRRIVFIPTTWEKFQSGVEINDLFDESPLEDRLWEAFKRFNIPAERQEFVAIDRDYAALDFAIYCARGCIDVETDGDAWHATPETAREDNRRDNALKMIGWQVLRFNTAQVVEHLMEDCLPTISGTINQFGGIDDGGVVGRRVELWTEGGLRQKGLFDNS